MTLARWSKWKPGRASQSGFGLRGGISVPIGQRPGVTPRGPQADAFALGGVGRVGRLKITTPWLRGTDGRIRCNWLSAFASSQFTGTN